MSTKESKQSSKSSETSDDKRSILDSSTPMNGSSRRSSSGSKSPLKPAAQSPQNCTWCPESRTPLKYVLPTQNGKKEFCSETCIAEFRKAYSKGACIECDNAIRGSAPNRDFCSTFCLSKHNKKKTSATAGSQSTSTAQQKSQTTTTTNSSSMSNLTNNNSKKAAETNNNNTTTKDQQQHYPLTKISSSFQYEAFQVFDWKEYLKVS